MVKKGERTESVNSARAKFMAFSEYVMGEVKRVEYNRERFESANYGDVVYV